MAIPTTKATFKSYCLRALGDGAIDINVSDDQSDDRIDEALQYFAQYHYDGIEKVFLKHLVTSAEVTGPVLMLPQQERTQLMILLQQHGKRVITSFHFPALFFR